MAVQKKKSGGLRSGFTLTNAARNRMRTGDYFLDAVHGHRADREQFIIYIGGDPNTDAEEDGGEPGVEFRMADRFIINLNTLKGIDPQRPILVESSSCGGRWEEGMQVFEAILKCPNPVTWLGMKWNRSMTSIMPLAADRFVLGPLTKYMYHEGTYAYSGLNREAATADIQRRKDLLMMFYIYSTRLKEQGIYKDLPEEAIHKILEKEMDKNIDVWLTADEAVRQGFADNVYLGDEKSLRATKVNRERRALMLNTIRGEANIEILSTFKRRSEL